MVLPPSTTIIWPVIKLVPVARKTIAAAISSPVAARFSGVNDNDCSIILGCGASQRVYTGPGATAFTLTSGANALASDFVMQLSAALLIA